MKRQELQGLLCRRDCYTVTTVGAEQPPQRVPDEVVRLDQQHVGRA